MINVAFVLKNPRTTLKSFEANSSYDGGSEIEKIDSAQAH
jgi:hypothetical protein